MNWLMRKRAAARLALLRLLGAGEWRCFHCGFETSDYAEARAHFGDDREDPSLCRDWSSMDDTERLHQLQNFIRDLNAERAEVTRLEAVEEGLRYRLATEEGEIISRFKGCRTMDQVWHEYHSMEGRALAAEAHLAQLNRWAIDAQHGLLITATSPGNIAIRPNGSLRVQAWGESVHNAMANLPAAPAIASPSPAPSN